ncbi:hypothetical protein BDP27DRAFT_1320216 [Rhodocollybia butyracea]|uniref:Uncharacterized protein n=1 Tax=Rhodocollybia butyracea TaxID=206335 RepID=A0A9P5UB09_9AGAR|nr:hypothetical protein BDP27DRAFT_1320216 [Rhodocollybia butyracea]
MLFSRVQLSVFVFSLFLLLGAIQIPLHASSQHDWDATANLSPGYEAADNWDISVPPSVNATGNLIFETINSLMQHWPNTRYRNGHTIVPALVRPGNVFYHGRSDSNTPTTPEWLATDPEHSLIFCRDLNTDSGCWMLTVTVVRPLKLLYFDGSSAAKMRDGSMDSQDILAYGAVIPEKYRDEKERINTLCEWAKGLNVDGFVRMEMDFEIMLCDFAKGVEVAAVNLRKSIRARPGRPDQPRPPPESYPPYDDSEHRPHSNDRHNSSTPDSPVGDAFITGSWHNYFPGDTRIQLDLTQLISFYDTQLVPSLVEERFGKERIEHRLLGISPQDVLAVVNRINASIADSYFGSGVDWATLIQLIVKRFSGRLEMVQYILNSTTPADSASENENLAKKVHSHLAAMVQPYMLATVKPSDEDASAEWFTPVYKLCSTIYTDYIATSAIHSHLSTSEQLVLGGVEQTTREICRVVTGMWVDGVMNGLDQDLYKPSTIEDKDGKINALIGSWRERINFLMKWLDWSVWLKCRPECGFEEICYLPTWPFRVRENNDSKRDPQPKCIPRM